MAGPQTRQKLEPRSTRALGNVSDRYYREGNVEGMKNINQELQNRIKNHPVLQPGTGYLMPNLEEPWKNTGPGSYWNVKADQPRNNSGLMLAMANNPNVNQMKNNYLSDIINSQYFGIGGYDFVEDRDPTLENLAFFQDIKDKDTMARDTNYQVTLPEHEKLGKLSGYELLPKGVYPYFNPSWIENNPSAGLDYMMNILGGTGKVGFRKGLDDDNYNAYAEWVKSW